MCPSADGVTRGRTAMVGRAVGRAGPDEAVLPPQAATMPMHSAITLATMVWRALPFISLPTYLSRACLPVALAFPSSPAQTPCPGAASQQCCSYTKKRMSLPICPSGLRPIPLSQQGCSQMWAAGASNWPFSVVPRGGIEPPTPGFSVLGNFVCDRLNLSFYVQTHGGMCLRVSRHACTFLPGVVRGVVSQFDGLELATGLESTGTWPRRSNTGCRAYASKFRG